MFHPPPSPDKGFSMIEMDMHAKKISINNNRTVPMISSESVNDSVCKNVNPRDLAEISSEYSLPYSLTHFDYQNTCTQQNSSNDWDNIMKHVQELDFDMTAYINCHTSSKPVLWVNW